jgi:hypothetical protein
LRYRDIPSEISHHLLYYLVHIWPLEIFLAGEVYGNQAQLLYQDFLFVQMGKHVTPDQFSKVLSEEMKEHCGAALLNS